MKRRPRAMLSLHLGPARWIGMLALSLSLVACATGPVPTASPVPTPGGSPSAPTGDVELRRAPAGMACDAIGVPYRSVTFRLDPAATEPVVAVTDGGAILRTFWSEGFAARDGRIVDAAGVVVIADGDTLAIPAAAWPRLGGYFVCPGPDALHVLIEDPA